MLCSLGLEVKSAAETSKTLRGITLITDTDILLSLVCEREANHLEITRIIELWQGMRGRVAAPVPALEEAAHHASIASTEYEATADLLTRIDDIQADHLLNNAFMRSFRQLAGSRTSRRFWESYIRQFRGQHDYDYSVLLRYLQEQFRIGPFEVTRVAVEDEKKSLYSRMQAYMIRQRAADVGKESDDLDSRIVDKCRRDALLLTMVQHARAGIAERGSGDTVIAISSSTLLKRMDAAFRNELGEPEAVISLSAVAVLLSLVPGVSMTLGTLRGVLFDFRLAKRLNPLQQYVYRLIARSDEYTLAWSKRVTLQRQLKTELLRDARSGAKRTVDVEREVLRSDNPEHSAEVVKRALDRMAIDSASETRIVEQQREIERLRALVEKLGGRSQ